MITGSRVPDCAVCAWPHFARNINNNTAILFITPSLIFAQRPVIEVARDRWSRTPARCSLPGSRLSFSVSLSLSRRSPADEHTCRRYISEIPFLRCRPRLAAVGRGEDTAKMASPPLGQCNFGGFNVYLHAWRAARD